MNITDETNKIFDSNKGFDAFKARIEIELGTEEIEDLFFDLCNGKTDLPYNGKVVHDNSVIDRDSYGSEDSTLEYIVYFEDYDTYVSFYGIRGSHSGTEFYGYKAVVPKIKEITIYE